MDIILNLMKWIIRHTERLLKTDVKWQRSPRFKDLRAIALA